MLHWHAQIEKNASFRKTAITMWKQILISVLDLLVTNLYSWFRVGDGEATFQLHHLISDFIINKTSYYLQPQDIW
jgi:hypothetical protein